MQVCRGRLRKDEYGAEVSVPVDEIGSASLTTPRYFADSVRDDYAAGQLDAQVWVSLVFKRGNLLIRLQVEGVLQEMKELSICGAN